MAPQNTVTPTPSSTNTTSVATTPLSTNTFSVATAPSSTNTSSVATAPSSTNTSSVASSSLPADSTQGQSPAPKTDGLTGGGVAGVAIGMLIAGFLIAGVAFLFLLRRQKRRQAAFYQMHHLPSNHHTSVPEKGQTVVGSAVPRKIDDMLPQPLSDDALTGEVSRIRDNIKNHALTYYHSAPVSAAMINEAGLQDVAAAADLSSSALVGALLNPSARQDAIRLIVGWVILSRCAGERNASLLPLDLDRLAHSILDSDDSNTTQVALYSKWKTITGVLLQRQFGKNAQDPNRAQICANIIAELDSILAPFVEEGANGGQRRNNLDMILTRSANFAFLLFSQPGSFQFDFASRHGGLVAFPALVQMIGDQGQVLSPPRVLMEKEVVAPGQY